ncbi:Bacterial alpha-L-rhamnosidase family [Verrucomicrobiia bacterium DG1235]|nr:Bacterial alpha-L-rhamnosidase family [Verrucomicrobiae bacterium DG1235]
MNTPSFYTLFLLFVIPSLLSGSAQAELAVVPGAHVVERVWDANWIAPADIASKEYGVYHYRKSFDLADAPERFVVHISADNRYRLFVNDVSVHIGPARGDLQHWRFDSLDIASFLKTGRNVLAVQVWNFGVEAPVAQISQQTALVMQGDGELESVVNTDASWRAIKNPAYSPISGIGERLQTYIVVGPGDSVDASRYLWDWEKSDFDDSGWPIAEQLRKAQPRGTSTDGKWLLVPRSIPLMESKQVHFQRIRRTENIAIGDVHLLSQSPTVIPANSVCRILLDQNELTTAYPILTTSGGAGSEIKITYAESLYEGPLGDMSRIKGNRDEVEGKHIRGFEDRFLPDGGERQSFRPLRWRTYRYVELEVRTSEEPLILESLEAEFTAYPFVERARFSSSDPDLEKIWEIAWRTIRTGTHEVYTDSPYYEQLSYVGDTRLEALVSLCVSGDDRMMRKSILVFDESRNANGLTSSRYPDSRHQLIPPYSLVWISMIHDFWRLRDDPNFVRDRLPGVREVLRYFREHSDPETGSYTGRLWWNYVDWKGEWGSDPVVGLGGVPPRDAKGSSAILDLQYVYTLQQARDLFTAFGFEEDARACQDLANLIRESVEERCWDSDRRLVADTSEKLTFSQHANAYFILTAEDGARSLSDLANLMLEEKDLTQATLYFSFYVHEALVKAGLGDRYLRELGPWRGLLTKGFTTLPETPPPGSRSDSHAWGAHPVHGMLRYVCGIEPGESGFKTVRIEPRLGDLAYAKGVVPHALGLIEVDLRRSGRSGIEGTVTLPEGLVGNFIWGETTQVLVSGENAILID